MFHFKKFAQVVAICLTTAMVSGGAALAQASGDEVVRLWPGAAPGTESWTGAETAVKFPVPDVGELPIIGNVTVPTMTVVRPAPGKANGTAIVVAPGGGFRILAIQHEGMDVAHWLAERGVTAFVLKYRVRSAPAGAADAADAHREFEYFVKKAEPQIDIARADALQAIHLIRSGADKYGIDPNRVGIMGFSAGAITTMSVVLKAQDPDRPNFAAPIYGAMEEAPVPKDAPPLFLAHAQGDKLVPVAQSIKIFSAWTAAGRSAELHVYDQGPHGFGMHKLGLPVDDWTVAFEGWLRANKLLEKR